MDEQVKEYIAKLALDSYRSMTFITTYQCTAACRECCFECSPQMDSKQLSSSAMIKMIEDAKNTMPNLELIVFSGGECFMLKDELFATIAFASSNNLKTRCVSNGYWGKTLNGAKRIAAKLVESGITEMNLSTGMEHQEWVPLDSILNCMEALAEAGIFCLVTVEKDSESSNCWNAISSNARYLRLIEMHGKKLSLACNSWMPFHIDANPRATNGLKVQKAQCDQLFNNLVITPYKKISACCGLTFEHIPDLHMGQYGEVSILDAISEIASDFLKIWLYVDGPVAIANKIGSELDIDAINNSVHICQACALLHRNPAIRTALEERYPKFVSEVVGKFMFNKAIGKMVLNIQPVA